MTYDLEQNARMNRAARGAPRVGRGAPVGSCASCGTRKSRLALYRASTGLVCGSCSRKVALFPAGGLL